MPVVCALCQGSLGDNWRWYRSLSPLEEEERVQMLMSVVGDLMICAKCHKENVPKYDWVDEPEAPTVCPDCGGSYLEDRRRDMYCCQGCGIRTLWIRVVNKL